MEYIDVDDDVSFIVDTHRTHYHSMLTYSSRDGVARLLMRYLPHCKNGSVLITTRSISKVLKLVEEYDNIIAVNPMDSITALALFEKKLKKQDDIDSIINLVTALEFIPLAIVQAASFISAQAPRYSVRQYFEDYWESDRKRARFLKFEGGQFRRDPQASNSVILTWRISFEYVRNIRLSAADLLSLMSFFDPHGIPESLIRTRSERAQQDQKENIGDGNIDEDSNDDHGGEVAGEDDDALLQFSMTNEFEDDVLILRDFSFVSVNMDGKTFEMHALVQLAIREWLRARGQQNRWKQQFIRNLYVKFPVGVYENGATCQALFPHVKSAAAHEPEEQETLTTWASLSHNAARYARSVGNELEAEGMSVQAMNVRKKILGKDHVDTLSSMASLASIYKNRGRLNEAEELEIRVMETKMNVFEPEHPDTLSSTASLAST